MFSRTAATVTTQSDRLEQPVTNRPGQASHEGILPSPTHKDLDTIVDNCRRGRTTKTAATKDLLESVERLTHLSAHTREKTFVSYLAEITSIDWEIVKRGPVADPTPGPSTNSALGPSSRCWNIPVWIPLYFFTSLYFTRLHYCLSNWWYSYVGTSPVLSWLATLSCYHHLLPTESKPFLYLFIFIYL